MNSSKPSKPPTLRPQHNGWTPARQQRFLDHLAATANVTAAAKAAARVALLKLGLVDH